MKNFSSISMITFTCFRNSASTIPRKISDTAISPPSLHYERAPLSHRVSDNIFSFIDNIE